MVQEKFTHVVIGTTHGIPVNLWKVKVAHYDMGVMNTSMFV